MVVAERGMDIEDTYVAAVAVARGLPPSDYSVNYQPCYDDQQALLDSIGELHNVLPVTTPSQIDCLAGQLGRIASGESTRPIVIVGECNEAVSSDRPSTDLVESAMATLGIVAASAFKHSVTILRGRGQNAKPRSTAREVLLDGTEIIPYMGDAVNGREAQYREPNPKRMVNAALQARQLERGLTLKVGSHVPAAHEALLLAYEESFIRQDPLTGDSYLLSADLPWIGKRTNSPDSEHVAMLAGVANPVGVKIGPEATAEHIEELIVRLNPEEQPGKLVLMFRLGRENIHRLPALIRAVNDKAPNTILMQDIHGATKLRDDGAKIRLVEDVIAETQATASICQGEGLRLHGVHLETMTDDSRLECIDSIDQQPQPGNLDPQLNPRQTRRVLDAIAPYLLAQPSR